jgi:AcrR family transcriptional regulator
MPGRKGPEARRREQILGAAYDVAVRSGIEGVTVRAVAARARLSHGLVLFHFKRKEQLLSALLERVLATTIRLDVGEGIAQLPCASDRVGALLRQEVERVARDVDRMRLFFDYWALGTRRAALRTQIRVALEGYRAGFRAMVEEITGQRAVDPVDEARPAGLTTGAGVTSRQVTADGIAAAAVGLILGCAVQVAGDPDQFDIDAYIAAANGVIADARWAV